MDRETLYKEIDMIFAKRDRAYSQLIALSQEQNKILLSARRHEIQANLGKFDPILLEMRQIDRWEESLINSLGDQKAISKPELDAVYIRLAGPVKEKAKHLHQLTQSNMQLLNNQKKYVDYSMGLIANIVRSQAKDNAGKSVSILLDAVA